MGYLLDEATNGYVFDESGNPVLGNGITSASTRTATTCSTTRAAMCSRTRMG